MALVSFGWFSDSDSDSDSVPPLVNLRLCICILLCSVPYRGVQFGSVCATLGMCEMVYGCQYVSIWQMCTRIDALYYRRNLFSSIRTHTCACTRMSSECAYHLPPHIFWNGLWWATVFQVASYVTCSRRLTYKILVPPRTPGAISMGVWAGLNAERQRQILLGTTPKTLIP